MRGETDPIILRWYESTFFEKDETLIPCIVEYDGTPIGYIQFYELASEDTLAYGYSPEEEPIFGLDQFIGETAYWNRGIGTKLIRSMVAYLICSEEAKRIVMDPQAANNRALHVYEKCGFVKKKFLPEHEWHEGSYRDCWLLEYEGEH